MSYVVKCFRSGNTLRISMISGLRYALKAQAGDYLKFEGQRDGVLLVSNLSDAERTKKTRGKK